MIDITLREVVAADLDTFFVHQQDEGAASMVGVSSKPRPAFMRHWQRILADPSVIARTVVVDGAVAGNIVSFMRDGYREVGYWLGRSFWGSGVATAALWLFVADVERRPLRAYVVKHNAASLRVLTKCGFSWVGEDAEGYILERPASDSGDADTCRR